MKFVFFLVLLCANSVFSQDTIAFTSLDKRPPTNFSQEMLYLYNGQIFTGVAVSPSLNQKFDKIQHFENGRMHGQYLSYYPSGKLKENCEYKLGRRNGTLLYYYESGQQMSVMHYKSGLVVDTTKTWFDNGQPKSMEVYIPGQEMILTYDIWFKNGQKQYEVRPTYHKRWHENGQLEYSGELVNGKPDGKLKFKNEKGKVYKIEIWQDGKKIETIEK